MTTTPPPPPHQQPGPDGRPGPAVPPRPAGPPGPAGQGTINFTVQGSVLTNNMVAPRVTINGHQVNVPTGGSAPIPAPAGRHHIEVVSQWLRAYGQAAITVDVAPGQRVDVFYAAPYTQFGAAGAIGLEPQKRRGLGVLLGVLGGALLLVLVLVLVPALLG